MSDSTPLYKIKYSRPDVIPSLVAMVPADSEAQAVINFLNKVRSPHLVEILSVKHSGYWYTAPVHDSGNEAS